MTDTLTYRDIILNIRGNKVKNLYLFYGSEKLLIRETIAAMRRKFLNPSFESLNYIKLENSSAAVDVIINACETLPFFDSKKIVTVNDSTFFKGKKGVGEDKCTENGNQELIKYFSSIPQTSILIFTTGDNIDRRKKICAAIKKNGDIVEFGHLRGAELLSWIEMVFQKSGKKISRTNAVYFSENVSGDLENYSSEIEKVCSFSGSRTEISRDDIDSVVSKSLESNIFKLVDFISIKKSDRALSILNDLILDSQPVPVILTMIIRQYRLLLNVKLMQEKGYSPADISRTLKIMPFIETNLSKISRNYTLSQIEDRLNQCLDTDISIKKGKMDQRIALETLIVAFSK